jgi:hypothetical protein
MFNRELPINEITYQETNERQAKEWNTKEYEMVQENHKQHN